MFGRARLWRLACSPEGPPALSDGGGQPDDLVGRGGKRGIDMISIACCRPASGRNGSAFHLERARSIWGNSPLLPRDTAFRWIAAAPCPGHAPPISSAYIHHLVKSGRERWLGANACDGAITSAFYSGADAGHAVIAIACGKFSAFRKTLSATNTGLKRD